jgi:hypothetical protein
MNIPVSPTPECPKMPHIARQFQHDVPRPPLECCLGENPNQRPTGLHQTRPDGAEGSKVSLEVIPTIM